MDLILSGARCAARLAGEGWGEGQGVDEVAAADNATACPHPLPLSMNQR